VISPDADQPLLLQLLKQVVGKDSGSWQAAAAAAARADKTRQQLASRAAGEAAADSSTPSQAAATAEAANAAVEASAASAAGELAAEACTAVAAGGSKLPSKSGSLLGTASVGEDSDLIGTQLEVGEEEEEQYATALVSRARWLVACSPFEAPPLAPGTVSWCVSSAIPCPGSSLLSRPHSIP
jgi:hypothetical protein